MIEEPFALFAPFANCIRIALFTKADTTSSDAEAARHLSLERAVGLHQIHGNTTVVMREAHNRTVQADGMLTDTPRLLLVIRWADCQNFVIYAPEKHVVGLLHVGWRGLVSRAIPEFFSVLQREWEVPPSQVYVGAGPSLCLKCAEYSDPHHKLRQEAEKHVHDNCVDLRGIATDQLLECGVPPNRIERHPDCTRCHPETYWTYRGGHRSLVLQGKTNMLCCTLQERI